jgi:anaerobic selenocysteine-containing dehydrogenase
MVTVPNTKLVYEAIKKLDLYVVMDFFMTPSGQLADYVLPATTYLERPWLWTYSGIVGSERAMPKSVPEEYDRRDDYDFWRGLGLQMGQKEEDWPWDSLEHVYDYRLSPLGMTFKEFMDGGGVLSSPKKYRGFEKTGFATPSGKIELFSSVLSELGYDPLPEHVEPPESPISRPDLLREYPFILITGGRHLPYYHSEHRQVRSARKMHPDPLMQIHPKVAEEYGISNGDWVWIESPRGRVKQRCEIFEGIDPRVVHAQHGWWFPEMEGSAPTLHGVFLSNINLLTDDNPDVCNPIHGGWPLRGLLCKIYRAAGFFE